MNQAEFRFYGALNDFLPPERQQRSVPYAFIADLRLRNPWASRIRKWT